VARFLHEPDRFDGRRSALLAIERGKTCWGVTEMTFFRSRYARRSATRIAIAVNGALLALMYLYAFMISQG